MQQIREVIIRAAALSDSAYDSPLSVDFGISSDINKNIDRPFPLLFVTPIVLQTAVFNDRITLTYRVRMALLYNHEEQNIDTDNIFRYMLIEQASERAKGLLVGLMKIRHIKISPFNITEMHNYKATNYTCSGVTIEGTIQLPDEMICL
jgi:hypothetical protein